VVTLEWIAVQPEYVRTMEGLEMPLKLNKLLPVALPVLNALSEQSKSRTADNFEYVIC
jgi:hypothetical protein